MIDHSATAPARKPDEPNQRPNQRRPLTAGPSAPESAPESAPDSAPAESAPQRLSAAVVALQPEAIQRLEGRDPPPLAFPIFELHKDVRRVHLRPDDGMLHDRPPLLRAPVTDAEA